LSRFDSVTYVLEGDGEVAWAEDIATRPRAGSVRRDDEERTVFDARRDACLRADGAMLAMIIGSKVQWLAE